MLPLWEGICSSWADDDLWVEDNTIDSSVYGFYYVLVDDEEEDESVPEGEEVFVEEEVCLFPSKWREWTQVRDPEEVCLFGSKWCEWTSTSPGKHGRVRARGTGGPRTKRNRRRQCSRHHREQRRRRALRRKQLARRARVGGRRRRAPNSFRGGGDSGDEGDQVRLISLV